MTPEKRAIYFITGTDTSVGKTVLAGLLAWHLRDKGAPAAALKPICSGGRGDARRLRAAMGGGLPLDVINPWHFRAALAPLLAARREKRPLTLGPVVSHVRRIQKRFPVLIVEGAGGLLSPLGEKFDSRDCIRALRATPLVVCANRLGAINQVRLVLAALPEPFARRAQVVLMSSRRTSVAERTNPQLLREILGRSRVHVLPWLKAPEDHRRSLADPVVRKVVELVAGARIGPA